MASVGINRDTLQPLTGFEHVVQSIGVILTTEIGVRLQREWFGCPALRLLGEPLNEPTLLRFFQLCALALTARQINGLAAEPRFRIIRFVPLSADRGGHFQFRVEGVYVPRGHLGDLTEDGARAVEVGQADAAFNAAEVPL